MSKVINLNPIDHIEYPKFLGGEHSGAAALRKRDHSTSEMMWTRELMQVSPDWHDLIGISEIVTYEVEHSIRITLDNGVRLSAAASKNLGLPRADAVGHHADGTITIIESKLDCTVVEMLHGVAQLLYYKTLMASIEQAKVAHLILASPSWPAYVIETICEQKLPIRLLKVGGDGQIAVAIPRHLQEHGHVEEKAAG